jgi:hypothetical protein
VHFAVDFEFPADMAEQAVGFAILRADSELRRAEVGVREQGDLRLMPKREPARRPSASSRRLLLGIGFSLTCVSQMNRARPGSIRWFIAASVLTAGALADDFVDLPQVVAELAGHAADHPVGVALSGAAWRRSPSACGAGALAMAGVTPRRA